MVPFFSLFSCELSTSVKGNADRKKTSVKFLHPSSIYIWNYCPVTYLFFFKPSQAIEALVIEVIMISHVNVKNLIRPRSDTLGIEKDMKSDFFNFYLND